MNRETALILAGALGVAAAVASIAVAGACGEVREGTAPSCPGDFTGWAVVGLGAVAMTGVALFLGRRPESLMAFGALIFAYGLIGLFAFVAFAGSALLAGPALLIGGYVWRARRRAATRTTP